MTTASERTKSVLRTRLFLEWLAYANDLPEHIRSEALTLTRHFPLPGDLEMVASIVEQAKNPLSYAVFSLEDIAASYAGSPR
ncbi:hypothetical protein IGB42_01601 [Andreprevotia sp. IGB-42]|uniref:BPSL0761 family protein n=1 Tax=Andreprevotia sp. IGB-42 TaxID=2497473 RepID=UPI0013569BFD|nr:BPSL0761 family protein [Andreprevotia sp. IGB-42]KAF0813922.1 hypothetical protein IGB42_01601 [Andreprevotia sp. IGB-42]